jgi:hypothetical protein
VFDGGFWSSDDFSFEGHRLSDFAVQTLERLDEHGRLKGHAFAALVALSSSLKDGL